MYLSIAKDYMETPAGDGMDGGQLSAEGFLQGCLYPSLCAAHRKGETLRVDLDGACGYTDAFLKGAFGGLVKMVKSASVVDMVEITSEEDPGLPGKVYKYMGDALRSIPMRQSEYIIWRCEAKERIEGEHPEWTARQVEAYLNAVERGAKKMGLLNVSAV